MTNKQTLVNLDAIDREIAFYRRRAGQVFFIGVTAEVLILAGRERIVVPSAWTWIQPLSYGILFIAVAAIGILLGTEYQSRIHALKDARDKLIGRASLYPRAGGLTLSEIEMLYVALVFLSSSGLVLSWINALTTNDGKTWATNNLSPIFWALFTFFVVLGSVGLVWATSKASAWSRGAWRRARGQGRAS